MDSSGMSLWCEKPGLYTISVSKEKNLLDNFFTYNFSMYDYMQYQQRHHKTDGENLCMTHRRVEDGDEVKFHFTKQDFAKTFLWRYKSSKLFEFLKQQSDSYSGRTMSLLNEFEFAFENYFILANLVPDYSYGSQVYYLIVREKDKQSLEKIPKKFKSKTKYITDRVQQDIHSFMDENIVQSFPLKQRFPQRNIRKLIDILSNDVHMPFIFLTDRTVSMVDYELNEGFLEKNFNSTILEINQTNGWCNDLWFRDKREDETDNRFLQIKKILINFYS